VEREFSQSAFVLGFIDPSELSLVCVILKINQHLKRRIWL